jgi:hypothetical protein
MPKGTRSYTLRTEGLFSLADGTLCVELFEVDHFLAFDPATERFCTIKHPVGRLFRMLAPRRCGLIRCRQIA